MRAIVGLTLLVCVNAAGIVPAHSQADVINLFGSLIRSGIGAATQTAWQKLPLSEIACVNRYLARKGSSINAIIEQGIGPTDPRVLDARADCRNTATVAEGNTRPKTVFSVDGLTLGGKIAAESAVYNQYQCGPSDQFAGFTWCQRRKMESSPRGQYSSSNSILHSADGTALYVNRYLEPAFFAGNEAAEDVQRLNLKFGESRIISMPKQSDIPNGMIAMWGDVKLEPLAGSVLAQLAAGQDIRAGLLIDHIGNFRRSAQRGLPVYRIGGGAGYVWAASWNSNGVGTLRFLTIDAEALAAASGTTDRRVPLEQAPALARAGQAELASSPLAESSSAQPSPEAPKVKEASAAFANLLEPPASCQRLREFVTRAGLPSHRVGGALPRSACPEVFACRSEFMFRANALIAIFGQYPELLDDMQRRGTLAAYPNKATVIRELQEAVRRAGSIAPEPDHCPFIAGSLNDDVISLAPSEGLPKRFDRIETAGRRFLELVRSEAGDLVAQYKELSTFNGRFDGIEALDRAANQYKSAMDADDVLGMERAKAPFIDALGQAKSYQTMLKAQAADIATYQTQLSDARIAAERGELASFANPNFAKSLETLAEETRKLGSLTPATRGNASTEVEVLRHKISAALSMVQAAREKREHAERLKIASSEQAAKAQVLLDSNNRSSSTLFTSKFFQDAQHAATQLSEMSRLPLAEIQDKTQEVSRATKTVDIFRDRLKADDERKKSALASLEVIKTIDTPSNQNRLSVEGKTLIDQVRKAHDHLAGIGGDMLPPDEELKALVRQLNDGTEKARQAGAQLLTLDMLSTKLQNLDDEIGRRGRQYLDAPSATEINEYRASLKTLELRGVPLAPSDIRTTATLDGGLQRLANTLAGRMDQEEKRQAELTRYAALDASTRAFVERRPEFRPESGIESALTHLSILLPAEAALKYCSGERWFGAYRKELTEIGQRITHLKTVLSVLHKQSAKIGEVELALAAGKARLEYDLKWGPGGPERACDEFAVMFRLAETW